MSLKLWHPTDPRHNPKTEGDTISFWVKTSTAACCDKFTLAGGNQLLGEWAGVHDWQSVEIEIPQTRPTILEWAYIRSNAVEPGATYAVWIKDISIK